MPGRVNWIDGKKLLMPLGELLLTPCVKTTGKTVLPESFD
jgi:hypothetical protein